MTSIESNEKLSKHIPATISQRFIAFAIDCLIVDTLVLLKCFAISQKGGFETFFIIYMMAAHHSPSCASIGEIVMGIRQTRTSPSAKGFPTFGRYFLLIFPIIGFQILLVSVTVSSSLSIGSLLFLLAWYGPMFLNNKRLAFHDWAARAEMVQENIVPEKQKKWAWYLVALTFIIFLACIVALPINQSLVKQHN